MLALAAPGAKAYGDVLWPGRVSVMSKKRYEKLFSNQSLSPVGDGMWPEKEGAKALKSDA